jgi:two-component system response regulator MprA
VSTDNAVKILIADDDTAVRTALERVLAFNGYDVIGAGDGVAALEIIDTAHPDALVLDIMMPRLDGLATCRMVRGRGDTVPILMLTARDDVGDRVAGLDAGADDYLPKPFELEELLARVRALLRRVRRHAEPGAVEEILTFADLSLNVSTREVFRGDRPVELTRTEFDLLETMMRSPRHVLSRSRLLEDVWGYDFGRSSNSLDVYVSYLRRKTEEGGETRLVQTVRGVGFTLREIRP